MGWVPAVPFIGAPDMSQNDSEDSRTVLLMPSQLTTSTKNKSTKVQSYVNRTKPEP